MSTPLPARPNLEHLRNEARSIMKAHTSGDRSVCAVLKGLRRFAGETDEAIMRAEVSLQEVQLALAIKYGFRDWAGLKARVEGNAPAPETPPRFNDVEELAGLDNAVLQMLFREIDDWCQAIVAAKGSARLRERFWENMTARHRQRLEQDADAQTAAPARIAEARKQMLFVLNRLNDMGLIDGEPAASRRTHFGDTPGNRLDQDRLARERYLVTAGEKPASLRTNAELVPLFRALSDISRSVGIVALEPIAAEFLDEELLRLGAELAADTLDYDSMRRLVESKRDILLAEDERRCDIGTTALVAIGWAEHPSMLEERCRALLEPGAPAGKPVSEDGMNRIEELESLLTAKPASRWTSLELIEFMKTALGVARAGGLLALDGVPDRIDDPFLKAPFQLLVDGCAVEIVRSVLLDRKRTLLGERKRRCDMIIAAVCGVAAGDSPRVIEAKCRAFLPA